MFKKHSMIGITLIIAILTILIAARHPTGPNTVSYDDPLGLLISIGLVIILFMPIYLLTLSTRPMFKILCTICLLIVVLAFLGLIPIGLMFPEQLLVTIIAGLGVTTSGASIIVTIKS